MMRLKKVFFIFLIFFVPTFVNAGTLEVESLVVDAGTIGPGQAGWDLVPEKYGQISITCTANSDTEVLSVSAEDFQAGEYFVEKEMLRLKVFYIGKSMDQDPFWQDHATGLLTEEFSDYDSSDPFIQYQGNSMEIMTGASAGQQVKIVLGLTIAVPESGRNIAGDYAGDLTFTFE